MASGLSLILRQITRPAPVLVEGSEQPYASRFERRHSRAGERLVTIRREDRQPTLNVPFSYATHRPVAT